VGGGFAAKTPDSGAWISLDSLVRNEVFQRLRWIFAENFFSALFPVENPGMGVGGQGHAEAQDCSWGELNLISDFLQ
jgi:hypothetical protein